MDELWRVIAELGIELHPDRITTIANKIMTLGSVEEFALAKSSFGPNTDKEQVERLIYAWKNAHSIRSVEVAAALRSASVTSSLSHRSAELVWTGPSTGMVPLRHTEQVLCEVIESARQQLFLVSFVAYEVASIIGALRDAVDRQVRINVLLEASTEHGGRVTIDSVKAMKEAVPSANVYGWSTASQKSEFGRFTGSVHAKCAVADGKLAFITSANLSIAAMERNMEIGVLVKGGPLPEELHRHLDALVATGIVERV